MVSNPDIDDPKISILNINDLNIINPEVYDLNVSDPIPRTRNNDSTKNIS